MELPSVLVLGCGYVGSELANLLSESGHQVTGATFSESSAQKIRELSSFPAFNFDVSDQSAVSSFAEQAFQSSGPDVIIHCASSGRAGADGYQRVYLEGTRNLASIFPSSHIIFTSSTSVYPQIDGSEVTELSSTEPDRPTARILIESEQIALEAGGAVARLSGIYGPGRWYLVRAFSEGKSRIEVNENAPDGRYINSIHRDDAASALAFLAKGKHKGIFNVSDDQPISQRDTYRFLSEKLNRPMPEEGTPDLNRKRAWTHKQVINRKLRELGWTPSHPSIIKTFEEDPSITDAL